MGKKDDAIKAFNRLQASGLESTTTAFVIFNSLQSVASFISSPPNFDFLTMDVSHAPNPSAIYWPNLHYESHHMFCRNFWVVIIMTLLLIFWSIPVIAIQGLANLDSVFKAFGGDVKLRF